MAELLAVRYPTRQCAEAGCDRLASAVVGGFVSVRAAAIVWVDRKSRTRVRQALAPFAERGWAAWLALTATAMCGAPAELVECQYSPLVSETLDNTVALRMAQGLERREAAVVVMLAEPTPLLLVEALRVRGVGLLRSTLPEDDEALLSELFRADHLA